MDDKAEKQAAAQVAVNILHEIATILNCRIDRRTLSICISMIENGAHPVALALTKKYIIQELTQAGQKLEQTIATN